MKHLLLAIMLLTPTVAYAENSPALSLEDHVYETYRCHAFKARGEKLNYDSKNCKLRFDQLTVRFIHDVSWDEFRQLPADKQSELSQLGFQRFKQWEVDNRPIFQKLHEKLALEMI